MFKVICLTAALMSPVVLSAQEAQTTSDVAEDKIMTETVSRKIALEDLGFGDGITFRQLSGSSMVYLPIPVGVPLREGGLQLDLRHGSTVKADRYLQVSIEGRPAVTQALEGASGFLRLQVPLRAEDVTDGFLALELSYSGAASDRVCVDDRASGDYLHIAGSSAFTVSFASSAIDTAAAYAALSPDDVRLAFSGEDTLAGLAAAVRASALYGAENGGLKVGKADDNPGTLWTEGNIEIETTSFGAASEMALATGDGPPILNLRGTDPQVGLWQLSSEWSGLTTGLPTITDFAEAGNMSSSAVPLSAFNADMNPKQLVSSEEYLIPFQSSDVPPGKSATGVSLMLAAAPDPEGRGVTASVFLNETLLGSRPLASGDPARLNFRIPDGLMGRDNLLRVMMQRQASGGECRFRPQGYPVQLLPGSVITLSDDGAGAGDFYSLRRDFGDGVQVVLDADLGLSFEDALPWVAGVAGSMIPDRSTIVARGSVTALEDTLPFFVVSNVNPGDGDPLITFDQGRIEVRDSQGVPVFAGDGLSRVGVVQIVKRGGATGLWLRPGDGPPPALSPERPLILDRGDLALIGEEGILVATSTDQGSLLEVSYPDRTSLSQILAKYRLWIVGGLWLLITLVVLVIFQRLYRRGNKPTGT